MGFKKFLSPKNLRIRKGYKKVRIPIKMCVLVREEKSNTIENNREINTFLNIKTEVKIMALSNLFGWNKKEAASACGSACGAADKPEEKPAACGAACGAADK